MFGLGFLGPCQAACGILAPRAGMEPVRPAVEVQSPNHWTTGELFGDGFFVWFGFFWAVPGGMWDLGSRSRDGTRAPCSGSAES